MLYAVLKMPMRARYAMIETTNRVSLVSFADFGDQSNNIEPLLKEPEVLTNFNVVDQNDYSCSIALSLRTW